MKPGAAYHPRSRSGAKAVTLRKLPGCWPPWERVGVLAVAEAGRVDA